MDDPRLTSEMIKLLRDELERTREQVREARSLSREVKSLDGPSSLMVTPGELYALQEENAQLKKELNTARARLAASTTPVEVGYDRQEQLASQLELTSKSEAEVTSLSQKVTVAREKRKQNKSSKSQLEDSISALEHHLDQLKAKRVEEQERLEVLQIELKSRRAQTPFDPFSFLENPERDDVPNDQAEILVTSSPTFELPEVARGLCVPDGRILKNLDEVLWSKGPSPRSRARCVLLATTHRYNPKLNNKGGWEPTWDMEERRGVRDLFYMKDKKWYYIGTYQWTGQTVFQYKEIRELISPYMHHLRSRTVLFPDSTPPVLTGIARTLIESGALKVACTGWRRVGFNNKLADALRSGRPSISAVDDGSEQPRPSNVIAVPKEGAREVRKKATKREGSDAQDGPKKKRKSS